MKPVLVPNLFYATAKVCCLGCSLKHIGVEKWLIQELLNQSKGIPDIIDQTDTELKALINLLPDYQKSAVYKVCCKIVKTDNGHNVSLLHSRYYHPKELCINKSNGDGLKNIIPAGVITEIFYARSSLDAVRKEIQKLMEQCVTILEDENTYTGLSNVPLDTGVLINVQSSQINLAVWEATIAGYITTTYEIEAGALENRMEEINQILIVAQRVSLVIVHFHGDNSEEFMQLAKLKHWIELISKLFGDTSHIAIVCIFEKDAFGLTEFSEENDILNIVNEDSHTEAGIIWY